MTQGRILIVDDEQIVLTGLHRVFEDAGYYIKTALGGKDALEMVKNEHFDIIYTDMVMPGMNGAELCTEIKKISPSSVVILFSGTPSGLLQFWTQFISAGGRDEILRKPLSKEEILRVTELVLKKII